MKQKQYTDLFLNYAYMQVYTLFIGSSDGGNMFVATVYNKWTLSDSYDVYTSACYDPWIYRHKQSDWANFGRERGTTGEWCGGLGCAADGNRNKLDN